MAVNLVLLLAAYLVRRRKKSLHLQAYANCTMYVGFCFVVYASHMQFPSLVILFAMPILMTVVFGDMLLTSFISFMCILAKILADVVVTRIPAYDLGRPVSALDWLDFVVSIIVLIGIYFIALHSISAERRKHRNVLNKELERISLYEESITDPATGVMNRKGLRRCFNRLMTEENAESRVLVMMDLDHFKEINDTYGHQMGDLYLKEFADLLKEVENAEVCRFGGDEFCMLLRGYSREEVLSLCSELLMKFRACEVSRRICRASVSFGAADYETGMAPSELVRRADVALYQAKDARGHAVFYREEKPSPD